MTLLKHPRDRVPVTLFFLFFAADFAVYWLSKSWWVPALWCFAGMIPKGWICAWNHHHQHVAMFRHGLANRLLEIGFALQTGVSTNAWMLHHTLGHHVHYLDQELDESGWQNGDGSTMGLWEYTWKNTLAAYPRIWKVGAKYPKHRTLFVWMGLVTLGVVAALVAHNPYNALFVYLVPMAVSFVGTVWVTWYHHAGLPTDSDFVACNNVLDRYYNLFTGNLGYHTAHHYRQAAHWSTLPELHAQIASKIPPSTYQPVGIPFAWFGRGQTLPAQGAADDAQATAVPGIAS